MKKKRVMALLLAVLLAAGIAIPAAAADNQVIHIVTAEDLRTFARNCQLDSYSVGLSALLDEDIDMGGEAIQPIPSFSGAFNGNGHSITNFTLATDGSHQGFFRYIEEGARVINLKLSGTITPDGTRENVGGIAGTNRGTITGCAFDGTVSGLTNVGGVAGENYGTVKNCTVTGKVTGKRYTGGVVGFNNGTIDSAYNHAEVNTSITASELELDSLSLMDMTSLDLTSANDANVVSDSGGVVGGSVGLIYNSVNYGTIGYQHYGYNVGGVAGRQSGYMEGCENHGRVYGRKDVGGIVGQMEPYMELALSEDLATELQTLHDLVTVTLSDTNIQNDDVNAALSRMQSNAYSAAQGVEPRRPPRRRCGHRHRLDE